MDWELGIKVAVKSWVVVVVMVVSGGKWRDRMGGVSGIERVAGTRIDHHPYIDDYLQITSSTV